MSSRFGLGSHGTTVQCRRAVLHPKPHLRRDRFLPAAALQFSLACYATNRASGHGGVVGRALLWRRIVCLLAWVWRPGICGYPHGLCGLFRRAVAVCRARRAGVSCCAFRSWRRLSAGQAVILGYLIYALGTNTFAFARAGAVTALVFIPLALAASAEGQAPGAWQDYVTIAGVWVAVKFSPSHWLWPYPGGRLAYVFTVLLCVNMALAAFLLVRRLAGVGYSIGGAIVGALHRGSFRFVRARSLFHWASSFILYSLRRVGRNGSRFPS